MTDCCVAIEFVATETYALPYDDNLKIEKGICDNAHDDSMHQNDVGDHKLIMAALANHRVPSVF